MAAALLTVIGVVALVMALTRQVPPPPQPADRVAAEAPPTDTGADDDDSEVGERQPPRGTGSKAVPELDFSRPVTLSIPRLDVQSSLVDIGLDSEGVMETPVPVDRAGWFTPSPPPGVPGATVIAGHVTWDQQPSVFYRLGELKSGDRVHVRRKDGKVGVFAVSRIATFPKDQFPTKAVYDQPSTSELRLITCGGTFDERTDRYLSNVVVWAKIVDVRRS